MAILVAAAITLGACAQVEQMTGTENCDDPALSPSEQLLCKDDKTFHQTITGGALLGLGAGIVTGVAACAAAGNSHLLACGAIGGGVGLFAGGVAGYVVAKQNAAAKAHVRAIDGVTDDIRAQNMALRREVDAATDVAAEGQAKLAHINAAIASGEMTAGQARAQRAIIAQDSAHLGTVISHLQEQEKNFADAGTKLNQPSHSYNRQLREMHDQIAALSAQKDTLDRAMSASG